MSKQSRAFESGACTPGFVASPVSQEPMAIYLGPRSLAASSGYPWNWKRAASVPIAGPSTVRLAPSGVCLALPVASQAVGSYSTVSPLPVALRPIGGLFSVALSVALPRPAVSWHSALWCPEVPPGLKPSGHPAPDSFALDSGVATGVGAKGTPSRDQNRLFEFDLQSVVGGSNR